MYVHNLGRIYIKFEHAFSLHCAQLDDFQSSNTEFYSSCTVTLVLRIFVCKFKTKLILKKKLKNHLLGLNLGLNFFEINSS